MHEHRTANVMPIDIPRIVFQYRKLILVPAVAGLVLAAVYAVVAPRNWRATQAMIVRAEATGISADRQGKFSDLSEMKTLQETILELAKSQSVITATLERAGKPPRHRKATWPTPKDVDDFRDHVKVTPPGGAEFGKTEVFYLSVLDTNRQRAKQLVAALSDELEDRMQQLRNDRASSMIAELENGVRIAGGDLQTVTAQLTALETTVGADLSELRVLVADVGGTSEAAQQIRDIEAEIRQVAAERRANQKLVVMLEAAQANPGNLAAMPNKLLESQPALRQLKQSLVDAQVSSASALGLMTEDHPLAQAALDTEQRTQEKLAHEFDTAVAGLRFEVQLGEERLQELNERVKTVRARIAGLAASRATYANLITSVADHTELLEIARRSLSDARVRQAGAKSASVIGRIDGVEAGIRPDGLGRKATIAGGGVGGLLLGLGLVFLIASPPVPISTSVSESQPEVANAESNASWRTEVSRQRGDTPFGMFRGMSLGDAIRKVEGQLSRSR
jgi:uncharacterized protein involved in exopolysaccharide biosynthesis